MNDETLNKIANLPGWCSLAKAQKLYELVMENQPSIIVEIGVYGGRSLVALTEAAQITNSVVLGIDPYSDDEAQQVALDGSKMINPPIDWPGVFKAATVAMLPYKDATIITMTSEDAYSLFPYAEVNLLHIDGNHSKEAVLKDLNMWSKKLSKNAIVVLDDTNWPTVQAAVQEFGKLKLVNDYNVWSVYRHE